MYFSSGSTMCGIFAMGSAMASVMTWMFCFPSLFHLSAQEYFMEIDEERVDEAVLALLYLTTFKDKPNWRAWKGHNWDSLGRLHQKGYISNPATKAKSVLLTEEGAKRSQDLFEKYFTK